MVLEFLVGHFGSVTVDDVEVGRGDFLGWGVAVSRCCIEHETLTREMPFLCLVLLLCVLLLDIIKLLAWNLFWFLVSWMVWMMPMARDQRMSAVSIVEGRMVDLALRLGKM